MTSMPNIGSLPQVSSNFGAWLQGFFVSVNTQIKTGFTADYSSAVEIFQKLVDGTGKVLGVYLLIWVMIEGYKILWGGSKQSMTNFMWDAAVKTIFIALAFNANSWISLVYGAFQGAKEYIESTISIGGASPIRALAAWAGILGDFEAEIWKKSAIDLPVNMFFVFFAFVGFAIGAFPLIRHLLINTISFLFLMGVAPLAFYFLIFKVTKNSFTQWLQMALANLFTLLFLNVFSALIFAYLFNSLITTNFYNQMANVTLSSIFFGILLNVFCSMAVQFAQQLTNVSLEGIAGSAMGRAMGIAGSAAGAAIAAPFAAAKLGAAGANLIGKGASAVGKGASMVANSSAGQFVGGLTKNLAKDGLSMAANTAPGKAVTGAVNSVASSVMNSSPVKTASSAMSKAKDIAGKINDYAKK